MNKSFVSLFVFLSFCNLNFGQTINRLEPPFWWAGMNNPELQLMAYGPDIASLQVNLKEYPGARLVSVTRLENPNYLVIDLEISDQAEPG
ncbi:MAG: cyclomaltodextrinase N-terminal domain-containing protein, partial [Bacteroidetes bacterium]|nr:cyclomaltodextrinase N-terminal domain-containing protein [Bacteroidota bacterium]